MAFGGAGFAQPRDVRGCSVSATCVNRSARLAIPPAAETLDYGLPQSTSTETLKMYVHNEPVAVDASRVASAGAGAGGVMSKKTISSAAVMKPISLSTSSTGRKNEIFVDILERLTVLFNANVRAPAWPPPLLLLAVGEQVAGGRSLSPLLSPQASVSAGRCCRRPLLPQAAGDTVALGH